VSISHVLDTSALIALFDAHPTIDKFWEAARDGELRLVVPSTAIAEATRATKADLNAWTPLLWPAEVRTIGLDAGVAIEIGPWPGELPTKHVLYEAIAVDGVAVTRKPEQYQWRSVPLLVV
jgi:hypothetical protein